MTFLWVPFVLAPPLRRAAASVQRTPPLLCDVTGRFHRQMAVQAPEPVASSDTGFGFSLAF